MKPKQRNWSPELYDRASEFHGHGGPFMIIGLRIGLTALRALDSEGWFGLTCTATLHWSPPDSCLLDGIQSSSGCTMGKRNLIVKEGHGISAIFHSGSKTLQITLKPEVYAEIKQAMSPDAEHTTPNHSNETLVNQLIQADDQELFTTTNKNIPKTTS
jgi:formylmethanofuran dehydrogenase subunit E